MEIKEWKKGKSVTVSIEYIKKSFDEGHFFESILLTHYFLERQMNGIFQMSISILKPGYSPLAGRFLLEGKRKNAPLGLDYNFRTIAKILFDLGVFDKELYRKMRRFNTNRNEIAHRALQELPTNKQITSYFRLGMELVEKISKIQQQYAEAWASQIANILQKS